LIGSDLILGFFRQDLQDLLDFLFFVSEGNKEGPIASGEVAQNSDNITTIFR